MFPMFDGADGAIVMSQKDSCENQYRNEEVMQASVVTAVMPFNGLQSISVLGSSLLC